MISRSASSSLAFSSARSRAISSWRCFSSSVSGCLGRLTFFFLDGALPRDLGLERALDLLLPSRLPLDLDFFDLSARDGMVQTEREKREREREFRF